MTWLTDPKMGNLHSKILHEYLQKDKSNTERLKVKTFNPEVPSFEQLYDGKGKPFYDVILSSERVGRAKDGRYYTMRGIDISDRISPVSIFAIRF